MVYLRVRKKDHLINNILPIFDKYPLFSDKNFDYLRLREVILSNYVYYEDLPKYTRPESSAGTQSEGYPGGYSSSPARARMRSLASYIESILNTSYFSAWLVGFIEAEGCFSIRKTRNNHSFSIGQKNDKYILENIKEHFYITNQIRQINNNFWFLEVYKKSVLTNIINHLNNYPLLGEKQLSFERFKDLFK